MGRRGGASKKRKKEKRNKKGSHYDKSSIASESTDLGSFRTPVGKVKAIDHAVKSFESIARVVVGENNAKYGYGRLAVSFPLAAKSLVNSVLVGTKSEDSALLQNLAEEHLGLVNNEVRKRVWPLLVGLSHYPCSRKDMVKHKDWKQIDLDVERSFNTFPKGITMKERLKLREKLRIVLRTVFSRRPKIHYYQGFHDICAVCVLVLGEQKGDFHSKMEEIADVCERIAIFHLRDALNSNLDVVFSILSLLFPLIDALDPEVSSRVIFPSNVQPFFALSWYLTWFSYVLDDLGKISRVFDFFLASHPLMPIYLSAATVIQRRKELFELLEVHPEDELYSGVHGLLSKFPKHLNIDALIVQAKNIFVKVPPSRLIGIANVFSKSGKFSNTMPVIPFKNGLSCSIAGYPYKWQNESFNENYEVEEMQKYVSKQQASVEADESKMKYAVYALSAGVSIAAYLMLYTQELWS